MATLPSPEHREEALIYTDSTQNLSEALNSGIDETTALEAVQDDEREKQIPKVIQDPPAPQQQPLVDYDIEQSTTPSCATTDPSRRASD